jgi:NADH:ubiquinone oxidoreductase subunit F (NADH-binding)
MLVTMSGAVDRPGVYEAPLGGRLSEVVRAAGGSPSRMPAVLVGGYFGSWLDGAQARRARLSNEHLRPLGAGLGCGAIVVLPQEACGLHETARILDWLAGETAGQCGSCVNGLAAIAGATAAVSRGVGSDTTVARLHRWAGQIEGRGACRFPDGAVRLLRSALDVFGDDVERHLAGDGCAAAPSVLPIPTTKGQPWR